MNLLLVAPLSFAHPSQKCFHSWLKKTTDYQRIYCTTYSIVREIRPDRSICQRRKEEVSFFSESELLARFLSAANSEQHK